MEAVRDRQGCMVTKVCRGVAGCVDEVWNLFTLCKAAVSVVALLLLERDNSEVWEGLEAAIGSKTGARPVWVGANIGLVGGWTGGWGGLQE